MASRSNDEMDILNGGGDDDSTAPGKGDEGDVDADAAAPGDEEEPSISVRQSDLAMLKDSLTQAMAMMQQYLPDEQEAPEEAPSLGKGSAELSSPEEPAPGGGASMSPFGSRSRNLRGI